MASLAIVLEGDGALRDVADRVEEAQFTKVIALPGGMVSGKPSIGVVLESEDGSILLGQTSLSLFLGAADAFRAKYGDPRKDEAAKGGAQ